mgnify:FL=1
MLDEGGEVDPHQAVFEWETLPGQTYDFILWEAVECQVEGRFLVGRGRVVEFKTGIQGGVYQCEAALLPDSMYYWSVRRHGVEEWSRLRRTKHDIYFPYLSVMSYNDPYQFHTPKEEQ